MATRRDDIYTWKEGFSAHKGVDAEVVIQEIKKIERAWKEVTPHLLVMRGRDPGSPLHPLFEWDDREAAERYRVTQARHVLAALRVVVEEADTPAPAFVHVRTQNEDDGRHDEYMEIDKAMSDFDTRYAVLTEALSYLQGYRRRYAVLSELANVWSAIDKAAKNIEKQKVGV